MFLLIAVFDTDRAGFRVDVVVAVDGVRETLVLRDPALLVQVEERLDALGQLVDAGHPQVLVVLEQAPVALWQLLQPHVPGQGKPVLLRGRSVRSRGRWRTVDRERWAVDGRRGRAVRPCTFTP